MDEPGPGTIGAMGDGPAATVAMSRGSWAAVVVCVCGRCGVVGGLVRDVGGSNRDVGGSDRSVGGWDRGVCGRVVDFVFRRRFDFSVADDGWDEAEGAVPTVLWSRGRRRTWSAACRRRWASWRAVSEFLSPAPGGRLGRPSARGRTRSLNRGWVCARRRGRRSQKTCAARTKGGGGWYPTLGLICRRRLRAVGRLAAHSNDVEGHCTLRQYPP